jgi:hypothetical protein
VGVTAADAAAIAAEADIVVEFPFSGVPGNKTLTSKVSLNKTSLKKQIKNLQSKAEAHTLNTFYREKKPI